MSVEAATKFLERMRDDAEFRKTFLTSFREVVEEARTQALTTAKGEGYEFTREELREALQQTEHHETTITLLDFVGYELMMT